MDEAVDDFREALRRAADMTADHLAAVSGRPVWQPVAEPDRSWLTGQPLPTAGRPLSDLLADVHDRVLRYPMGNGHPGFFGWVNSPPSPAGVLVASLAAAMNPSCAGGEHAGALLERTTVRWLADLVGFPHRPGGGLLTSGTSVATIIALAAARNRAASRQGQDIRESGMTGQRPMAVYVSAEGHSCLRKAVELLGLGSRYLRTVPVDDTFRMDPRALEELIVADAQAGIEPLMVAASAGTVNTGAIDPLEQIAGVAERYELWFHIDGAYGAVGVLDDEIRHLYAGLERADSLALDPHKWLSVPVDCGCILLRDPHDARAAFSFVPPYLRDEGTDELGWFSEYGPEQTRPFRALRLWATIAHLGREGISSHVRKTVQLARALAAMIDASDDLDLVAPPITSVVAFRYRAATPAATSQLNEAIPAAVQRRGHTFLTGTHLTGAAALRACILHPETTEAELSLLLREIRAAAQQLSA